MLKGKVDRAYYLVSSVPCFLSTYMLTLFLSPVSNCSSILHSPLLQALSSAAKVDRFSLHKILEICKSFSPPSLKKPKNLPECRVFFFFSLWEKLIPQQRSHVGGFFWDRTSWKIMQLTWQLTTPNMYTPMAKLTLTRKHGMKRN